LLNRARPHAVSPTASFLPKPLRATIAENAKTKYQYYLGF
jgi:hypothetical protein